MKSVRASTTSRGRREGSGRQGPEIEPESSQTAATMSIPSSLPSSTHHYWPTGPRPQETPSVPYVSPSSSATGEEGFVRVPLDDCQIRISTHNYGSTESQDWYHDFRSRSDSYQDDDDIMREESSVGCESQKWCFWGFVVLMPLVAVAVTVGIVLYLWPML